MSVSALKLCISQILIPKEIGMIDLAGDGYWLFIIFIVKLFLLYTAFICQIKILMLKKSYLKICS